MTFERISWPVRTDRLTFRPCAEADIETTWRYRQLPDVSEWITRAPTTIEAYREQFLDAARMSKTMVFELDGQVIGDLMLDVQDAWAQAEVADQAKGVEAELGWVLDPAYGGKGYATEAVLGLIRVCFEELRLRRVVANCFADNESSWRLMERIGMRREVHTRKESLHRSGEWMDGLMYALLAEEWPTAPSR